MKIDFNSAFSEKEIDGKSIKTQVLGKLRVPTGKIVVSDPLATIGLSKPLNKEIPAGEYDVAVSAIDYGGGDWRHMLARLSFGNKPAVKWESVYEDKGIGVSTDAGTLSFCDEASQQEYLKFEKKFLGSDSNKDMYNDLLAEEFKKNSDDWVNFYVPDTEEKYNVIMFESGFGDGSYPCCWGLDESGDATELVIDFQVVEFDSPNIRL